MKKRNVLIIYQDQTRCDCLPFYGNNEIIAPNLEALSKDSTVFEHHYCSFPVCTPSRFSFLSGTYASEHAAWTNHSGIPESVPTFAKVMRNAGYRTQYVGKMHASPTYLDVGFDKELLSEQDGDGRFEDDYHEHLRENGLCDMIDVMDQRSEYRKDASEEYFSSFGVKVSDLPEEYHNTTWVTDNAVELLETWQDQGELLMVSYIKPHHPFDPSQKFVDMYEGRTLSIPEGYLEKIPEIDWALTHGYFDNRNLDKKTLEKMVRYYYASITEIDHGIGRILDTLKRKGLYEDTIILFSSDHGDYLGYHHMALKGGRMYEPLARIPLLIKTPEKMDFRTFTPSDNSQVASTILKLTGLEIPFQMRGRTLFEEKEFALTEDLKYDQEKEEFYHLYALRNERYTILFERDMDNVLLFDRKTDPYELRDISSSKDHQDLIEKARSFLVSTLLFSRRFVNHEETRSLNVTMDRTTTEQRRSLMIRHYEENRSRNG